MPKGGRREGAGRPKGSLDKKTLKAREYAIKLKQAGITPLEVLLNTMRALYALAVDERGKIVDFVRAHEAAEVAAVAAPYVHAKLTAIEARIEGETRHAVVSDRVLDVEQWEREHANPDLVLIPRLEGEGKITPPAS